MNDLPFDLCDLILRKLNLTSRIRLGAVSRFLRQITKQYQDEKPPLFPWLMLQPTNPKSKTREFINLEDDCAILRVEVPIAAAAAAAARGKISCCGSSQEGWMVLQSMIGLQVVEQNNHPRHETIQLLLINPLSQITIELPLLEKRPYDPQEREPSPIPSAFHKTVCSTDPSTANYGHDHDCIVAATDADGTIYFCKLGDPVWTVHHEYSPDVVFYKGQFISYNPFGQVLIVFEYDHLQRCVGARRCYVRLAFKACKFHSLHLVNSCGELLLVLRTRCDQPAYVTYEHRPARNLTFEVFVFDSIRYEWVKVDSLGDRILFVGYNASKSVSAKDFPTMNLKGNCIYFNCNIDISLGVYHLEDGRIEPCFPNGPPSNAISSLMWFTPNPL